MKKIILSSVLLSSIVFAGGYRIPESSTDAVALSAACIANANGADASYYNPANMAFSDNAKNDIEIDVTYIGLSKVDYKGTTAVKGILIPTDTSSESEDFIVPTLHYVSPKFGKFRVGLSIVSPGGLSKRWKEQPASLYSQEFTLTTVEINPTFSYKLTDKIAIGGGIRAIYSDGEVKNAKYEMTGDGFDFGYNVAISIKPDKKTTVALTYKSKVDLDISGDTSTTATSINSLVDVSLPIPAVFSMALAYTWNETTTLEGVIEKDFWSKYKTLDFNFDNALNEANLGNPIPKNWKDTTVFRLGLTHKLNDFTVMLGYGYDESPVPDETLSYELPSSPANIYSIGGKYRVNQNIEIAISALTSIYKDRKVSNRVLNGEFSNSQSYLASGSIEYKF